MIALADPARLAPTIPASNCSAASALLPSNCTSAIPPPPSRTPLRAYTVIRTIQKELCKSRRDSNIRCADERRRSPRRHLLRRAQPARAARRGDALRDQADARTLDRELLAGPAHDLVR